MVSTDRILATPLETPALYTGEAYNGSAADASMARREMVIGFPSDGFQREWNRMETR